jgi:hypothetical protein
MQQLPAQLTASFERRLNQAHVPQTLHPNYHKWIGFYINFCQKYGFPPNSATKRFAASFLHWP